MSDLDKELSAQRDERAERLKMTFYNLWKIDDGGLIPKDFPYPDVLEDYAKKARDRRLTTKVLVMRAPNDELHVFPDYNVMLFLFFSTDTWLQRLVGLRDFRQLRRRGVPAVMYELDYGDTADRDAIRLTWVNYESTNYFLSYYMGDYLNPPDRQAFIKACAGALIGSTRR